MPAKKKAHFSSGTKKGSSSSSSGKDKKSKKKKKPKSDDSDDEEDDYSFKHSGSFGAGGPMCFGPCGLTEAQATEVRMREMEDREFRRLNGLPPRWFYTSCDYGYGSNCARDREREASREDELSLLQCVSAILSCFSCCLCCFGCYAVAIGM